MKPENSAPPAAPARLGLWDTISIIVGIMVGVGIFKAPAEVFQNASGPWQVMGVWALGGVFSLVGALCFAELASAYPRSGGEYVYLTHAYGRGTGFLFAWAQLVAIRPGGGIAMPAFVLADSAAQLWGLAAPGAVLLAAGAIGVLTLLNILGATLGKTAQNLLTLAKVAAIGGIVAAGFLWASPRPGAPLIPGGATSFVVMMMVIMYTYDGWNEAAYVSREVRDGRRNVPLALILGTTAVMAIYLLINGAYLAAFGFDGARAMRVGPADILTRTLGPAGGQAMNILIIVSVLGALTGVIFTGSRMFSELGADHRVFAPLGWWSPRLHTPVVSLLVQSGIGMGMVLGVGAVWQNPDGFSQLLRWTSPVFYLFLVMTALALFLLRWREPKVERPFKVPLYPLTPLLFCGWSSFMLVGCLRDVRSDALMGLAVLLAGLPLYLLSQRLGRAETKGTLPGPHRLSRTWSLKENLSRR